MTVRSVTAMATTFARQYRHADATPMIDSSPALPASDGARHILAAALENFAAHGYDGASMHAIANRAGVSKANVFHHFESKEQLYLAVLSSAAESWGAEVGVIAGAQRDFPSQLRAMVRRTLAHMAREPDQSRVVLRELLDNGKVRGRQLSEDIFAENFRLETGIFRRAQARGELRAEVDPILAWTFTMSVCIFFFQTREVLRFNDEFPYARQPERFADEVCDVLLNGIARRDPTERP